MLDTNCAVEIEEHHRGTDPFLVRRSVHGMNKGGFGLAAGPLPEDSFLLVASPVLVLGLLLSYVVGLKIKTNRAGHRTARKHHALPLFDVEGGSPTGSRATLPEAIAVAIEESDVRTVKAWVSDQRCNVNASRLEDSATAMHLAARCGIVAIIRVLLDAGADPLSVDSELRTPLHLVALAGHGVCVKVLLDSGADVDAFDCTGKTPLLLAEERNHTGCFRMMKMHCERKQQIDASVVRRAK